jgi:hypothetical protein
METTWIPDVLVLGPGGAKGFLEVGALYYLEQENFLDNVTIWEGISVGAPICLLKVCGYNIPEVIEDCMKINLLNDIMNMDYLEYIRWIQDNPGLFSNKTVENILIERVKGKFGMVPTLEELYNKTGLFFSCITYNSDKMRKEKLNHLTTPNLSCVEAVMMSMPMPGIISPRIYNGNTYTDGAIGNPYSVPDYDDGTHNVLGIYIESECSSHSSAKHPLRMLYRAMQASMKELREEHMEQSSDRCKHLGLTTPVIDATGLSLSDKSKLAMIDGGYRSATLFLSRLRHPEKYNIILDDNEEIPLDDNIPTEVESLDDETLKVMDILSHSNQTDIFEFNDFVSDCDKNNNEQYEMS